jgi:hypothetical protein
MIAGSTIPLLSKGGVARRFKKWPRSLASARRGGVGQRREASAFYSGIGQHHPVCAAKEWGYFIDGAATPSSAARNRVASGSQQICRSDLDRSAAKGDIKDQAWEK